MSAAVIEAGFRLEPNERSIRLAHGLGLTLAEQLPGPRYPMVRLRVTREAWFGGLTQPSKTTKDV